jgi:glucose/arabinose dehydrogenase
MFEPKRRWKRVALAFYVPLLCALLTSLRAEALPEGLKAEEYVTGLTWPIAIAVLPGGDLIVTEKAGAIRLVRSGVLQEAPLASLDPVIKNESGLLGLVLTPSFETSAEFLVSYTPKRALSSFYVSKLKLSGERAEILADPWLTLPCDPDTDRHYGGNMRFAQGKLYLALSELDNPALAQDLRHPFGSILRYNEDSSIPSDNPFGPNSAVFAKGLRNTFDFAIGADGVLWGAENGGSFHDELNRMTAGGNYGWPNVHGFCDGMPLLEDCGPWGKYAEPAFEFLERIGPTGIEVYDGALMPELSGNLLFGGWHSGRVDRFTVQGGGAVRYDGPFFTIPGGPHEQRKNDQRSHLRDYGIVDVTVAHDGALYVLTSGDEGRIYRIAPEGAILDHERVVIEGEVVHIKTELDPGIGCQTRSSQRLPGAAAFSTLLLLTAALMWRSRRLRKTSALLAVSLGTLGYPRAASAFELHYGGKAGLTIAKLRGNNTGVSENTMGIALGAAARMKLHDYFSVEADLLYAQKGSGISTSDERLLLQYLSLPLLAQGTLPIGPVTARLFVGPVGSLLLAASVGDRDRAELIETFDFGLVGGAGVDVALPIGALTFDAGYERGVNLIVDRDALREGTPYEYNKNSTFYALLGFLY